ncbi:MAG: SpoIID/LytB domain-containing protein [Holophagaceae bacterium]|nr:SpoIID/LytB domain-containing protein [Holophagaceae bacterium]
MTILFRFLIASSIFLQANTLVAQKNPNIKVGLSLTAIEHVISLEGGGAVCNKAGKTLIQLRSGERLRIWLDTRGNITSTDEYRIQIGPPLIKQEADGLVQKIKRLGESPECLRWPDGDTWRVLLGSFPTVEDADVLLQKLIDAGFYELWVTSEKKALNAKNSRGGLYGITEKYERIALPSDGVMLKPNQGISTIEGKGGYRGRIDIYPNAQNRLSLINTLDMESYLRGVVPKEMGAWAFPSIEALKAQAVAARTYAYANLGKRSKDGFDLLDTPLDQVYGGKDGEQSLTDRAVEETRGLIATLNGRPIQALFMATGGGATVDNTYVFGGAFSYLKGVSNYPDKPKTLSYKGISAPADDQSWLSWEIARMLAEGLLTANSLEPGRMSASYKAEDFRQFLTFLTKRFKLPAPNSPPTDGIQIYIWMAKILQFDRVISGIERPLDATYFLQNATVPAQDQILAGFLTRRGIITPMQWRAVKVSTLDALQALGRMWHELEPFDPQEGTLLLDGQVRPQRMGPTPLKLGTPLLILEEYPGGFLRMVSQVDVQVGDRVKWINQDGGSRLFVRRLDPDGASYDRYNVTAHWKVEMTEAEVLASLRSRTAVRSLRTIELKHNENGRVVEMIVRDRDNKSHRFTGMRIRGALNLRDNVFRYITTGEAPNRKFIFYGRGWGHGVGMDQTGAYGMALEGYTFDQILKHYYKGISIQAIQN